MFLLFTTAGLTFSMHYCGGNYVSTSINKEAKSCCDGSGGCCENKTLHFEIKGDFVAHAFRLAEVKVTGDLKLGSIDNADI